MKRNVFFAALRRYLGHKQWRSIDTTDLNYAISVVCMDAAEYGLTGSQALALENAVYSLAWGVDTGRMPTEQVMYFRKQSSQRRAELVCTIAEQFGNEPVGAMYEAWREMLLTLSQESQRRTDELCAALSANFAPAPHFVPGV